MSRRIDDRWLWLGFGVFLYVAAHGIRYAIRDVVQLTKLEPLQNKSKSSKKTERPEDTLSLANLQALAESPNQNIANAATSLILSRFLREPNAYRSVQQDMDSAPDERTRIRARQALSFLRNWPLMADFPDLDLPRFSPSPSPSSSRSGMSSPEIEDMIRFAEAGGDGWVDSSASAAGVAAGTVIPSLENPVAGWTNVPRERPSESEAERRRGRREAMVLREGAGGVEEGDIIRPVAVE